MVINDWWAGDPAERYWMEITDRTELLGDDLNAPTLNGSGRPEWSYSLVAETRPGDIVFHWHKNLVGQPALVGWSEVLGPLAIDSGYTWLAHGTRGRARGVPTSGHGWVMPCSGLTRLPRPVSHTRLAELEPRLRDVHRDLAQRVRGALYFPFNFHKARPLRAAQAYLTKFPSALLAVIPELAEPAADEAPAKPSAKTARRGSVSRYLKDSLLRMAIERYAVERAKQHYFVQGATEIIELGKPYDLLVRGLGAERHVEVKGSSTSAIAVELTANEVYHAHHHVPTDLVVVDGIEFRRAESEYELSGGQLHVFADWQPEEEHLSPTRFRYDLPSH